MKLSKRQRQCLRDVRRNRLSYISPVPSAARRTVEGLVKRGLVEWVNDEQWANGIQYRITAAGVDAFNATIPVPDVTPMELARMEDKDLKTFVLHYCDGKIFTDKMARPQDLGMVFMPLVFGALQLPEGLIEPFEEDEPEPPEPPTKPEPPPKPEALKQPEPPPELEAIRAEIQEIHNRIEWGMADSDDILDPLKEQDRLQAEYQQALMEYTEGTGRYQEALAAWKAEKAAVAREFKEAQRVHQEELKAYRASLASYNDRKEAWMEIRGRALDLYLANLGIVYEYYDQAGPRSVNGQPIFWSCRLMHREDWDRAVDAINRELKRREDFEL